jgi:3-dehydroquinate synthase
MTHALFRDLDDFGRIAGWLDKAAASQIVLLCDRNTRKFCVPLLRSASSRLKNADVICIDAGEKGKSLASTKSIWKHFISSGADRDAMLVNVGGGAVTDAGGFAASVFKRGIRFVHVPTTTLAMADAAIGGKTAINVASVKNVVGSFAWPEAVFIAPKFLSTLPGREYDAGFAEVYKIAAVYDHSLWKILDGSTRSGRSKLLHVAAERKLSIVNQDPFDKGIRRILNFGHTLGHAIESAAIRKRSSIRHGEAVAAGMVAETAIARRIGLIKEKDGADIINVLRREFPFTDRLLSTHESISEFIRHDKKNKDGKLLFSLPTAIGSSQYNVNVSWRDVKTVLRSLSKELS